MQKKLLIGLTLASIMLIACANSNTKPTTKKFERFQTVAIEKTTMLQSGKDKYSCPECGMKLPLFYKTNHTATSNGKVKQYCSIHCLAEDKSIKKSNIKDIKVVAVDTLKFISVKDATYVVGSDVKGTMSSLSKYAFEGRMSARRFAKEHQGRVMSFDEAYEYALKDFK
ncbi:hypothetical protein MNB_SV-12-1237 [hydrothermal vent metagenome]|uniref:Nitrous oxide reductase maturation protein, outer-membrane lipoprotein NosL n=1 Tax=hydrothermal vent metagenome TaxID=652676 RepID=A0A1W1C216_9ZZZZ